MDRRVVAEGMNAYYARDADTLRKQLERLAREWPHPVDAQPLATAVAAWLRPSQPTPRRKP